MLPTVKLGLGFQAPTVSYGQSGGGVRLSVGSPVYRDSSGLYWPASAVNPARSPGVGIVALASIQNLQIGVITNGFLSPLTNWAAATGSASLVVGATYYLSNTPGRLAVNAADAGALIQQAIGRATSTTTMQVLGNTGFLPATGLTTEIRVAENLTGSYWMLKFEGGLLVTATHVTATSPDLIMADGAGGFWKLIVDAVGNIGAEPNAGPATDAVILQDDWGGHWKIVVDANGHRGAEMSTGPSTGSLTLTDSLGGQWQVVVDHFGNLGATINAPVVLGDGAGGVWCLIVDADGEVGAEVSVGPVTTSPILTAPNGTFWMIVVDTNGNRGTQSSAGPPTGIVVLLDPTGAQWQLLVDNSGNLGAQEL